MSPIGCNCRNAQQRAAADAARRAAAQRAAAPVQRTSTDPTVPAAPQPRPAPNPYGTTQSFSLVTDEGMTHYGSRLEAEAARVRAQTGRVVPD